MNRAEAIPVDGSRSTTEPPSGGEPAALLPAPAEASPPQVTMPVRAAGGTDPAGRPTVRLRPPAPAPAPYRGRAAVVTHRGRADGTPDGLPVRRAESALVERSVRHPGPWAPARPDRPATAGPSPWPAPLPDRRDLLPDRSAGGFPDTWAVLPDPPDSGAPDRQATLPAPPHSGAPDRQAALPAPPDSGSPESEAVEQWAGQPAETRTAGRPVTRRTGGRRGPVAARRVVGL